jgi:hypothetical protein
MGRWMARFVQSGFNSIFGSAAETEEMAKNAIGHRDFPMPRKDQNRGATETGKFRGRFLHCGRQSFICWKQLGQSHRSKTIRAC